MAMSRSDATENPGLMQALGYGLAGVGFLAGFLDIFSPSLILAALALITAPAALAMAAQAPDAFEVSVGGSPRLFNLLIGGPVLGVLLLLRDVHVFQPWYALGPAIAAVAIIAPAALRSSIRTGVAAPVLAVGALCLLAGVYAFGATLALDTRFDTARGTAYPSIVQAKSPDASKPVLTVAPWAPQGGPTVLKVDRDLWAQSPVGSQICPVVHKGVLMMPWYSVGPCDGRGY